MKSMNEAITKPWYKHFWPWFLMSFPLAAVIAGITTIIIATKGHDHAVVDDYYKKGLAINRVISQQETAASMGLSARANYEAKTGKVSLKLTSGTDYKTESLSLSFVHTTRADFDRHVILHNDGSGNFTTTLKEIQSGRWKLILEPADKKWRLDAHVVLPSSSWHLKPNV
jgi:hypothetical protein